MNETKDEEAAQKTPLINWRSSAAKQILMDHLEQGILPLYEEHCSVAAAWNFYKALPEFKNVHFEQFQRQLKAHRKQVICRKERVGHQEAALIQFRDKNPRKTHNHRGEPVFDMMPGKKLLRQDIKDGRHLRMKLNDLRESREEFQVLTPLKLKERVSREIRRQKYIHFLELKTEKEQQKRKTQQKKVNK